MYIILKGQIIIEGDDSTEFARLEEGDFFGETGIIKNSIRMADVISLTECQLLELRKDKFNELIAVHPELGLHVEKIMEDRNSENEESAASSKTQVQKTT